MSDFKTSDFKNYEESTWQKPHPVKRTLWQEPANKYGSIPQPLYRLLVSVLNNDQGRTDYPTRIFVSSYFESPAGGQLMLTAAHLGLPHVGKPQIRNDGNQQHLRRRLPQVQYRDGRG
jgi:hypothetical protein